MGGETVTRVDLREALFREVGFSRNECADMVERILSHVADALVRGEGVKIAKFGTFNLRDKSERMGRNPRTNVPALIEARRVVTFRPSSMMREQVDEGNRKYLPSEEYGEN